MTRALKRAAGNWDGRRKANKHTPDPGYKPGDHWVECQRCGFDVYASNARTEWTGAVVCEGCFDFRQTQDFVRGRQDSTAADGIVRPAREDVFTDDLSLAGGIESSIGEQTENPADDNSDYSTFNLETL